MIEATVLLKDGEKVSFTTSDMIQVRCSWNGSTTHMKRWTLCELKCLHSPPMNRKQARRTPQTLRKMGGRRG